MELKCPQCNRELYKETCVCGFSYFFKHGYYDFLNTDNIDRRVSVKLAGNPNGKFEKEFIKEIKKEVNNIHGNVLDCGGGTGFYSYEIFKDLNISELICIDLNAPFCIDYLNKNNYYYIKGDIFRNPFKKNYFDCIVSFDVIEHIENDVEFIRTLLDILKINGKIIIGTPNKNRITVLLMDFFKGRRKFPYDYGTSDILGSTIHVREYSREDIIKLLDLFKNSIIYEIKAFFFGWRTKNNLIGLKYPFKIIEDYCMYWLIIITKKQEFKINE